jgi:hypothetical protein
MILSALIQKNGLLQLATLTVATPATPKTSTGGVVATTITVVDPEIQKAFMVEVQDSPLNEPNSEPVAYDLFFTDDRRHCSECSNLSAGRCLAAWRGEIVAARQYRPIDDIPRRCEGYAPKACEFDQRSGKQRWPNLHQADY